MQRWKPKKTSSGGRPTQLQQHLRRVSLMVPCFNLSQVVDESLKPLVTCTSCHLAAKNPLQLFPCRSLLCYSCSGELTSQEMFQCPGCSDHHISLSTTFSNLSSLEEQMFNNLMIKCQISETTRH